MPMPLSFQTVKHQICLKASREYSLWKVQCKMQCRVNKWYCQKPLIWTSWRLPQSSKLVCGCCSHCRLSWQPDFFWIVEKTSQRHSFRYDFSNSMLLSKNIFEKHTTKLHNTFYIHFPHLIKQIVFLVEAAFVRHYYLYFSSIVLTSSTFLTHSTSIGRRRIHSFQMTNLICNDHPRPCHTNSRQSEHSLTQVWEHLLWRRMEAMTPSHLTSTNGHNFWHASRCPQPIYAQT